MSNPYVDYYANQIGSGIPGFQCLRRQRGYGFLSSFLSKTIIPMLKDINFSDAGKVIRNISNAPGLQPGKAIADDIARIGGTALGSLMRKLKGKCYKRKYKKSQKRKKRSVRKAKRKSAFRKSHSKTKPRKKARKQRKANKKKSSKRRKLAKIVDALG